MTTAMKAREERAENLVVYGVPESGKSEADDRKRDDKEQVEEMVEVIGVEVQGAVEVKFRTGKKVEGDTRVTRPRPMVFRIADEESRQKILENASKLARRDEWERVFVSPDLIWQQREAAREEERKLREEAERKKRGKGKRKVRGGGRKGAKERGVEAGGGEGVSAMFLNAQSLGNKMSELRAVVSLERPAILAVNESWTNDAIDNGMLGIQGYERVERSDRRDMEGGRGGGLLVCASKELCVYGESSERRTLHNVSQLKSNVDARTLMYTMSIYRSPNSTSENDDRLCDWILDMRGINVLIGDFNFPDIDWETGTTSARGRKFYPATETKFMEQHVNGPTHVSGNTLDLIQSDREGIINAVRGAGRLGKSDHEIILFLMRVDKKRASEERSWLNYRKAAYEQLRVT